MKSYFSNSLFYRSLIFNYPLLVSVVNTKIQKIFVHKISFLVFSYSEFFGDYSVNDIGCSICSIIYRKNFAA